MPERGVEEARAQLKLNAALLEQSQVFYNLALLLWAGLFLAALFRPSLAHSMAASLGLPLLVLGSYCELRVRLDRRLFEHFEGEFSRGEFEAFDEALKGLGVNTSPRALEDRLAGARLWFKRSLMCSLAICLSVSALVFNRLWIDWICLST